MRIFCACIILFLGIFIHYDGNAVTLTCLEVLSGRHITVDVYQTEDINEAIRIIENDISYSHVDTSNCREGGDVITPMYPKEYDIDRPGKGYLTLELERPNPQECEDFCAAEKRCMSWTYHKPTDKAAKAKCTLKKEIPERVGDQCCISGVKK